MTQDKSTGNDAKGKQPETQIEKSPLNIFRAQLSSYENNVVQLLSDNGMNPDKFMIVVENSIRNIPKLLECDRGSLFGCILTSAEFGLEPNTPAQLSWIIPYYDKKAQKLFAQFQIGYHGIVNLLYRNDRIKKIHCEMVYENDKFDRYMDNTMEWQFRFKPSEDGMRGMRKGVFAIIHLENAEPLFQYMSTQEIGEIQKLSKNPAMYGDAKDPQGWMWKKAVLKQVAKVAPKGGKNNSVSNALNMDSMIEGGATVTLDDTGKVTVHKQKERNIEKDKLNIVFGSAEAQEAEVIDEQP